MLTWALSIWFLSCLSSGFSPVDNYLIDCGSSTNTSVGNRVFIADNLASKLLSTPQDVLAKTNSNSITTFSDSPLYQTARVFTGSSKYNFSIGQSGRHWIRLYFYPFVYISYNMSLANFAVSTQDHVLLSNFSVKSSAVIREYSLNVTSNVLVITFTPSSNSFAFLNAIEVVSVPSGLITDDANTVSPPGNFKGLLPTALETVWRVNMGGQTVIPDNDTLWRTWIPDKSFLVQPNVATNVSNVAAVEYVSGGATQDTAPPTVYGTAMTMNSISEPSNNFNVSWEFNVDPGFQYLVRFHFCDIVSTSLNQLYFNVFIDPWIVVKDLDLSTYLVNQLAVAYYMDYVLETTASNKLRISVGPSTVNGNFPDAILNGLEIMKMNSSEGSLSAADSVIISSDSSSKKNVGVIVGVSIGAFILVVLAGILFMMCRKRRRLNRQKQSKTRIPLSMGSKYSNNGYGIPFLALQEATNNFDEMAVKKGNPQSQQGLAEFQTEIEMLSQFRHRHLVSLIGYCDEKNEMILVYEYMENGTLKSHLYGSGLPSMSWKERLEICIGAARGLHYLHTGYTKVIIHRDVKSANILLDENLMAKVADFGLSKTGPEIDQTHVSTKVRGSFGYLDPEYFRRQKLTEKSDVYSFGVVLIEVLCARSVFDSSLSGEMLGLAEWAMEKQKRGQLDQIIDATLVGNIRPDSLRKFGEIAEKCLADSGVDRPSMGDVLWNLEYALQLQERVIDGDPEENNTNLIGELSPQENNTCNSAVPV
uniref:Protein kinase domain-containing protein n=1 Tax=Fagus sylvatica TaxID=28930 RepID=A0A2N9E264_FAGSY